MIDYTKLTDLSDEDLMKFLALLEAIHSNSLQYTLGAIRGEINKRRDAEST